MEPGGRRRSGLYADIPVPVLQVPAGEEGGPGGLPNLLKEEEKEEDEEEKKEDDDEEEEMEGKRRDEEDMPNIMKYLVPPQAPDHLPLANLPCLLEQGKHCGMNFSKKSSLSRHMLVIHGASRPFKILQDIYLAKLMALRRISFAIRYITFKMRISFKEHMKRDAHLLAP